MSVTSSKLLDGMIAGLAIAVLLVMLDLVLYQEVNWSLTVTIATAALIVCSVILPSLRKNLHKSRSRSRVAG